MVDRTEVAEFRSVKMRMLLSFQGQVQSGLRSGIRLAQGSYIRITVTKPIPVQVDGEPWIQSPGQIIISAAGPKVLQLFQVLNIASESVLMYDITVVIYLNTVQKCSFFSFSF